MNDGQWFNWNSIQGGKSWQWDDVHYQSASNTMTYTLEPGDHALYVCYRENGAAIDKFYITNTGKIPSAMGGVATNCIISNLHQVNNADLQVNVYPNPAVSEFRIETTSPIQSVVVFNSAGGILFNRQFENTTFSEEIRLETKRGIYFVKTTTLHGIAVSKMVLGK